MKKVFALALAVSLAAVIAKPAFSAQANATSGASVSVNDLFEIELLNAPVVLGNVSSTAESSGYELDFFVKSNHALEWYLELGVDPILHSDAVTTLPLGLMQYTFTAGGAGVKATPAGTFASVPGALGWVYTSDPAEYSGITGMGLVFKVLPVSPTQKPGAYSTTVRLRANDPL